MKIFIDKSQGFIIAALGCLLIFYIWIHNNFLNIWLINVRCRWIYLIAITELSCEL